MSARFDRRPTRPGRLAVALAVAALLALPAFLAAAPPVAGAAAIGSEPTLVILCRFSDQDSTTARTAWDAPMFGPYIVGGRSHRDYYREVSYYVPGIAGLDLPPASETCGPNNDGIAGWYSISYSDPVAGQVYTKHPSNVYAPGWEQTAASQYVAAGAVMAADADVNFAAFDLNGDTFISAGELHIIVILAGNEGSYGNAVAPATWRHHWSLGLGPVLDGVTLLQWNKGGGYSMLGELDPNGSMIEIGLVCHETGHDLGLPDLYDPTQRSEGIGEWGLMGSGDWCNTATLGDCPSHLDPWCKNWLGWLNPIVVGGDVFGVAIPQVETNPTVYKLWSRGLPALEYFLVENRQRVGYDQGLVRKEAADGLVVWHVNYPKHNAGDNEEEIEKFIDVECADGLAGHIWNADDLDAKVNRGDAKDPWYLNNDTDFHSTSAPDNRDYRKPDNFNTSVEVRNVGASGNPMTADLLVGRTTYVGSATYTANGQSAQFNLAAAQDFMRVYYLGWNCCGNTYVYELDNQGAWVNRATWCFSDDAPPPRMRTLTGVRYPGTRTMPAVSTPSRSSAAMRACPVSSSPTAPTGRACTPRAARLARALAPPPGMSLCPSKRRMMTGASREMRLGVPRMKRSSTRSPNNATRACGNASRPNASAACPCMASISSSASPPSLRRVPACSSRWLIRSSPCAPPSSASVGSRPYTGRVCSVSDGM